MRLPLLPVVRWAAVVTCLVLVAWALRLAPAGHYSGDAGVKYIQAWDLARQGFATRALAEDRSLDPAGEMGRVGAWYEWRHGGRRLGVYSIVFETLVAPLVAAAALSGAFLVPLLGAILVVVALARLLRRLHVPPPVAAAAVLLCGLGTPIFFYSAQLFEHTLAAGLVTTALLILHGERRRPETWAGVLGGAAAIIRPECYCALSGLGIGLLVARRSLRPALAFAAAASAVVVAYAALNSPRPGPGTRWSRSRSARWTRTRAPRCSCGASPPR